MLYSLQKQCMALCVNTSVVLGQLCLCINCCIWSTVLRMYVSINSIILCHKYMSVNLRLQQISNYVYKCYMDHSMPNHPQKKENLNPYLFDFAENWYIERP